MIILPNHIYSSMLLSQNDLPICSTIQCYLGKRICPFARPTYLVHPLSPYKFLDLQQQTTNKPT
ncbi:hypothetical protein Hanom_Chr04g00293821 [Helianthus anomalus]